MPNSLRLESEIGLAGICRWRFLIARLFNVPLELLVVDSCLPIERHLFDFDFGWVLSCVGLLVEICRPLLNVKEDSLGSCVELVVEIARSQQDLTFCKREDGCL